jgi:hypothetical protein
MQTRSLVPEDQPIAFIDIQTEHQHPEVPVVATADHELIRRWALDRRAEPATGEATDSGPATLSVNDEGTGLRFNFPGVSRFRPINWAEWLRSFDDYSLAFVYDRDEPGRPKSHRYRLVPLPTLQKIAHIV